MSSSSIFEPTFERIIVPYIKNLQAHRRRRSRSGASMPAQYERRVKSFDFDVTTQRYFTAPDAGRRAQELLGLGGGQDRRQLQSRRHQRPRRRCAHRQGDGGQIARGAGDGRRAPSIACCGPGITGCRSGIRRCTICRLLEQILAPGGEAEVRCGRDSIRGGTTQKRAAKLEAATEHGTGANARWPPIS